MIEPRILPSVKFRRERIEAAELVCVTDYSRPVVREVCVEGFGAFLVTSWPHKRLLHVPTVREVLRFK